MRRVATAPILKVDRPPILVCASLAITLLMLAGAIYVLAFYLR
jgi:hypothetical protein